MAEPLEGTHLAEADCVRCGAYVLAIPEKVNTALCVGCGRTLTGATVYATEPPDHWRVKGPLDLQAAPAQTGVSGMRWKVRCPKCLWRGRVSSADLIYAALRVHETVRHDPNGWASGIAGGMRRDRRWGR